MSVLREHSADTLPYSGILGHNGGMNEQQHGKNLQNLEALAAKGFTAGDALSIEVFFTSESEDAANAIAATLEKTDWSPRISTFSRGIFTKTTMYAVEGGKRFDSVTPELVDRITFGFLTLAAEHDAEFDGWGAALDS